MVKKRLNKIVWMLLVCLAVAVGTDSPIVATCQAATQTQAQKAKAQREKEKAKQAKARAKAKEKAAKEREKAAQQKAKAAQKAQPAKQAQPAKLSKEEAYQQKVEEIEKYNAYVSRYMSRDISHRLGFWGQVGYSNLFPKDIQYRASDQTGFDAKALGGVGGGGGAGYQMRYKRLLVTTGVEMQVYTSAYELSTVEKGVIQRVFDIAPYQGEMQYTYRFANSRDRLQAGFVQIPVLAGMEFANKYAYFLAGPKIGLGVIGSSVASSSLSTSIYDKTTINPYEDMFNHALVKDMEYSTTTALKWNLHLAVFGEIGMSLDPWIKSNQVGVRLAAFAEYGVLNIQSSQNLVGNNDQPVDYTRVLNGGHPTKDVAMVSSLSTTTAQTAVNPFLVGIKATCWFDLPRKELRMKNLPKEPLPGMKLQIVDSDSYLALAGAVVSIASPSGQVVNKTTGANGLVALTMPKGEYRIAAHKVGYYADSTDYLLDRDMRDTLKIRLKREPVPMVYTLAGRVYSKENQSALETAIQITSMDNQQLYSGISSDDGLFVTGLKAGRYIAHLRCHGYMPYDDTIQFKQDTLSFFLTKIKEGVKVKIENLFFATNRTYILPQSEEALQNLTQFLLDNQQVRILVVGHTDNVGSDQANQILSEGRASNLRLELIKRGVDANRIEAEGRGEKEPVATNDTEEGRALNRRVEFTILSAGK